MRMYQLLITKKCHLNIDLPYELLSRNNPLPYLNSRAWHRRGIFPIATISFTFLHQTVASHTVFAQFTRIFSSSSSLSIYSQQLSLSLSLCVCVCFVYITIYVLCICTWVQSLLDICTYIFDWRLILTTLKLSTEDDTSRRTFSSWLYRVHSSETCHRRSTVCLVLFLSNSCSLFSLFFHYPHHLSHLHTHTHSDHSLSLHKA